ncbi:MAG TPA: acyloxyacyl hydrolase [Acidobacteriaceae bacterium]|nr:acyloxyacyl hydrolase [Acidobacteriaceae bacterium]
MKKQIVVFGVIFLALAKASYSQTSSSSISQDTFHSSSAQAAANGDFVHTLMQHDPWDRAVFMDGGFGTSGETSDHFLNAGVRLGKVLTDPVLPGVLRGQFEYAIELIPYWQAFTPKQTYTLTTVNPPRLVTTGGTYPGLSMTPIILRWNLVRWKRVMPWVQGAGGLVWTNHKFPPNGSRGTSVWNFEPQFGLGIHYFVKPGQAITFAANAVHISNASLGDANPGVNATVQFQIGYTWWK